MTTKLSNWLRNLVAALVTGGSSSALASLGISGASGLGADVKPLDFKQMGIIALAGGVVGLLAFLKQSPLPPSEDDAG